LLAEMHSPLDADSSPACGVAGERGERWRKLEARLNPVLDAVLGPALETGAQHVFVLAPGALRTLPLIGLRASGQPLFARVSSVVHLPSLDNATPLDEGSREACLLGKHHVEGDTAFGESAIETLRRWFEPRVLRPPQEATTTIVEVDQLEPIATTLRSLRFYGVGSVMAVRPALACMDLEGQRRFIENNTRDLFLPHCEVELWAATAGSGPVDTILRDNEDRIPGLARCFLLSGARGVLDLAWPVHDLVKALICERFGIERRTGRFSGPAALAAAISWAAETLLRWRDAAGTAQSPREALAWLDEVRRAAARDAGPDPRAVISFASRADAPCIAGRSVREILDEVCCSAHFAAFRWWGWLEG
ncbi:MAG TPA: hypothetical protein VLS89_07450, partial [Candidatus Nanopelagicales bacterium]|nr:hypothetical protein [Candidatus Nanopelagicales bacterium]